MFKEWFSRKPKQVAASKGVDRRIAQQPRKAESSDVVAESSPNHINWGTVRCERRLIENSVELGAINFASIVNDDAKLALHLYSSIAIAKINETSKECILFIDKESAKKEEVEAAVLLMRNSGYMLSSQKTQGYFLTSALVLSLSKKDITSETLKFQRQVTGDPKKNSLMSAFTDIVNWAFINKADDIDFVLKTEDSMSQICFKIGGKYVRPERWLIPSDTMHSMLGIAWQKSGGGASSQYDYLIEQQANVRLDLPRSKEAADGAKVRLRWSGLAIDKGQVVTMRIQRLGASASIRSLSQAGYVQYHEEIILRVLHSEGGMTVLAGTVGSGKSTTLVQMVNMLPHDIKIQTLEDPVELDIPNAYQKTVTRDLTSSGKDESFSSAVKALYRSALDVLYLGEVRDEATGLVARQVVESGHSVYTTTHAKSALGTVDRFVSPAIGMPRDVLATPGIIKLLVFQALLPTNCPHCAKSPDEFASAFNLNGLELDQHQRYFGRLEKLYGIESARYRMRDHQGCDFCRKAELPELNGLSGRTVVAEMIEPDEEMLGYVFKGDNIGRDRYWRSMASPKYDDPNLAGKTTMECAILKATSGVSRDGMLFGNIDPREIEPRFMSFETVEFKRMQEQRSAHRQNTSSIVVPLSAPTAHLARAGESTPRLAAGASNTGRDH